MRFQPYYYLVIITAVLFSSCSVNKKNRITDFGAVGDAKTLNTKAIQKAIDACSPNDTVFVPAGQYVTGTIKLKSNMVLFLEKDAELLGSINLDDYATDNKGAIEAPEFNKCLVYGDELSNVTITGEGRINGRGSKEHFPIGKRPNLFERPMLIRMVKCKNINFSGVEFKDAGSWCTHLIECEDLVIKDLTINNLANKNNDGLDLDNCKNVLIEGCTIHSGDDAICPKSTTTGMCENIVVKNCIANSHTSAFKTGTSSRGGFKNITVTDCDFSGTRMGAIKLLTVDGGILEDITISNIKMDSVEGPIFIRLGNRGVKYDKPRTQVQKKDVAPGGAPIGSVKNIHISNIKANVVSDIQKRCGIMISGIPDHYIENVTLENIEISYPGGGTAEEAKNVIDEDIARYPEQFFFGVLPSWGAYIRHAKNVTFKNIKMSTREPDARKEFVFVDVTDFKEVE